MGVTLHPWRPEDAHKKKERIGPLKPGAVAKKVQPTVVDDDLGFVPDVVRLKPNTRLDGTPYTIIRWLGEGGMGVVFEAHHTDLDRRVALKVLRSSDVMPVAELFRQEAKALAKVGSNYVVQVFDFVTLRDGRLIIAMELIDGQMLSDLDPAAVPHERLIPILRQACKGLAAAHRVEIVHRDVKPANIALVQRDGREDAVTLLDFGVALFQGSSRKRMAGTPGYVAPEVIGGKQGDTRADIYALGCVAYLYAAGRSPFVEKDPQELLRAHLSLQPEPPSTYADVPEPLERLIMRCLEKDPNDRYEDANDLEAALCEVQIELNLHTPWDDLPIPDVEEKRRARLLKRMPELLPNRAKRWWSWALVGAAVLAGAMALPILTAEDVPAAPFIAEVDELTHRANAAAAQAFFVYPPPERPDEPTAFKVVRELEDRADLLGEEATRRATELRKGFADTLSRLGDQYWEQDGGRPFALDYYAQALVFDPQRQPARERAMMSPGELRLLRKKAETADFTPVELEAAEPLLVLAEVDEAEKQARLDKMDEREESRPSTTTARLDRLVPRKKRRKDKPPPQPESSPPPQPEPSPPPQLEPAAPVEDVTPVKPPKQGPDRDEARRLSKEADAARRRGDSRAAEKLYAQALEADRRYSPAFAGLARIQYDAGKYALAARTAQRAVRLAPKKGDYRILLGDALYKTYDRAAAKNQYQRAKELGHPAASGRLAKVSK